MSKKLKKYRPSIFLTIATLFTIFFCWGCASPTKPSLEDRLTTAEGKLEGLERAYLELEDWRKLDSIRTKKKIKKADAKKYWLGEVYTTDGRRVLVNGKPLTDTKPGGEPFVPDK